MKINSDVAGPVALVGLLLLFGSIAPYWMPNLQGGRIIIWATEAGLVTWIVLSLVPPREKEGALKALIYNEINYPEVSRLLTFIWFILLMSAYLTCALWNVGIWELTAKPLPLDVNIPPQIWLLAGIVVGPAIAAAIITSGKVRAGELHVRATCGPLSTMFLYEDKAVEDKVDFTATYHFLVQITILIAYFVAVGRLMYLTPNKEIISEFPTISDGVLVIAAGTAGVYIANRSISRRNPHTS